LKKLSNLIVSLVLFVAIGGAQVPQVPPLPPPDPRYKADILLIVAHPDDETAIGSYLAKAILDDHKQVAVIYCNRGTGGGNTHGMEQNNAMGAIREIEALRATAILGIHNVWFLNGRDTPGQDVFASLENWHHGAVLEDVIRLVRLTRPEVIMTWLPDYVQGENHGDHQASGVIATEAFDMAGDPVVFPAQVAVPRERLDINNAAEGLPAWQAQKTGDYSKFLKQMESFHLIFGKSVVKGSPRGDVFEGITAEPVPYVAPRGYQPQRHQGVTVELGGVFAFYRDFWWAHNIERLSSLVKPEVGIAAGAYLQFPVVLRNDTPDSVDVVLTPRVPEGWEVAAGSGLYCLAPGEVFPAQTMLHAPMQQPAVVPVTWQAESKGKEIGRCTMTVTLSDWTLPQ
jgi:LmbE family N-acetylglucosaminyl deacetylase